MARAVSSAVILGVGNLLRQDEGVGIHAVREMAGWVTESGAALVDGGTAVFEALSPWKEIEKLVVIDALRAGNKPGTILRLSPKEVEDRSAPALSLHQHGLLDSLALLKHAGLRIGEVVIYGIEPAQMEWGTELTEQVAACLPRLVSHIREELGLAPVEEKQR